MLLPIGRDNFKEIIDKKLRFIDKTLFIKDILDNVEPAVILITRPRRFGKTLNLSMLYYFLAKPVEGQSTLNLFEGLQISQCGEDYLKHQGQYPVISLTFKDLKEPNYSFAREMYAKLMRRAYADYKVLLLSPSLDAYQKEAFNLILQEKASEVSLKTALFDLTQLLYQHYGKNPWLLIDEYDSPIHTAYAAGYYEQMIEFMRGVLGAALKNNPYLEKAVITGILRVSKESLFSGVNNLEVYSLSREEYSEYFGFTELEVDNILRQANLSDKAAEIKHWYNGYSFGKATIYNPWSIANCVKQKGLLQPYWVNTSGNQLIQDLLQEAPLTFKAQFEQLMQGESIEQLIDENMVFADFKNNNLAVWSLLLMSGYLTIVSHQSLWNGRLCQLRVPNQEVNNLYRNIIGLWLAQGEGLLWYNNFTHALVTGDIETFHQGLEKVLVQIVSVHDMAKEPEAFFHGLLLGFIAHLQDTHEIQSNRESGFGRYDIALFPKNPSKLGIVIELKAKSPTDKASLEKLAEQGLQQIQTQHYASAFEARGIHERFHLAIAFQGKRFALRFTKENKSLVEKR